jgi:hypothetical protein
MNHSFENEGQGIYGGSPNQTFSVVGTIPVKQVFPHSWAHRVRKGNNKNTC